MPFYMFFALGIFSLICAYIIFINRSFVRAALLLALSEVFLALPVLLLLKDPREKTDNLTVFLLALLFMPMNLPSHCFFASYFDLVLNLGSFLRPLIGIVLIVHLMKDFSFPRLLQGIKKYYGPKEK